MNAPQSSKHEAHNPRRKAAPAAPVSSAAPVRLKSSDSPARRTWARFRSDRAAKWSFRLLLLVAVMALLTPLLPLQSPRETFPGRSLARPDVTPLFVDYEKLVGEKQGATGGESPVDESARFIDGFGINELDWLDRAMFRARGAMFGHWRLNAVCGRDQLGRDLLSRIFWGARVSLAVGIVATLVSLVVGVCYGAVAGYFGGWVDAALMRVVDILQSVPFIFVVILLIAVLDARGGALEAWGMDRVTMFYFVVGAIFWMTMARVIRGQVKSLRQEPFVEAARASGSGHARILFRHIVPHTYGVTLTYLTLTIPRVMLFEAFLSYLGLGVAPPDVSWGLLLQDGLGVITPLRIDWWLIVFPSAAMVLTLLVLNVVGDGLRDTFEPKHGDGNR